MSDTDLPTHSDLNGNTADNEMVAEFVAAFLTEGLYLLPEEYPEFEAEEEVVEAASVTAAEPDAEIATPAKPPHALTDAPKPAKGALGSLQKRLKQKRKTKPQLPPEGQPSKTAVPPTDEPQAAADKKLLIVNYCPISNRITTKDRRFLANVIKPLGKTIEDLTVVNLHGKKRDDLKAVLQQHEFDRLMVFGLPAHFFAKDKKFYHIHEWRGIPFVLADALTDIARQRNKKKALWKLMKQLFEL